MSNERFYNSKEYISHLAAKSTPSMRYEYGTDFPAWRTAAKAKLEELLGLPLQTCDAQLRIVSQVDCDGYTRADFEFQSEEDYVVRAAFLRPLDADGKLPCAICLQGHSSGMHISFGEARFEKDDKVIAGGRDFAVRAVREGLCAVTLEQRYMGTAGAQESGAPGCLVGASIPAFLLGRTAIGERVWDVQRLIDVLIANFDAYIDFERLICLGNSGGGTTTFYASCLDERIKVSVPSCCLNSYEDSIMTFWHCPCNYVPSIRRYFDMGDIGALIAPRKLVSVSGQKDKSFPIKAATEQYELIRAIYRMLGAEENCTMIAGTEGHQFYPDEAWPIIHRYIGK